ncbi:DMT family transporter [Roseovarius sp. ZX-A-9]|uniref:DMT family transporter n=1 Tax=Roseovarius sp. ZX-A-9 TaxID=3014783 RepID=UPI002330FD2F|nr:DMT family transporter [Roseovarius sp. ZX-A-9]
MTTITHTPAPPPSRALHGIACAEIGMVLFVVQDVLMKTMLDTHPVWHLILARSLVTLIVLTPIILWLGGPHRILTPFWKLHLVRAALLAMGFSLFYSAFPLMGLAEVTTIFFSAPLMTALLAAVVLRETIGIHRILALVVGFVGVIIAMNPGSDSFTWVAILPLICALTYAISQILARQMGEQESTLTMGLQTIGFMGLMILPIGWLTNQIIDIGPEFNHLRMAWPTELARDWPQFLALSLVGMTGWMLLTRAYQVANASLVAPFDYTYMPIALVVAWVLFDEVPPTATWLGMTLIVASGLYLGYRELRATRHRDDPTNVAESTFAPGIPMPPPTPDETDTP